MMKLNANEKIGKWTLLEPLPEENRWLCRCDCGTTRRVLTKNLREGVTKSCGCARTAAHHAAMAVSFPGAAYGTR